MAQDSQRRHPLLRLLPLLLLACWPIDPKEPKPPPVPGVRLIRPLTGTTVPITFEAELEVSGTPESAGIELYTGEGATVPSRRTPCTGSCTTTLSGFPGTHEVRGWAIIGGETYETERQRITIDGVVLVATYWRVRAPNVVEVRFNKPISFPILPTDVQVVRRIPVTGGSDQTDSPKIDVMLENEGRTLLITGDFGVPAFLTFSLHLTDSLGAWKLEKTIELTQGYFTDVEEVAGVYIYTYEFFFDREGRPIASVGVPDRRRFLRREKSGAWVDLIAESDPLAPCLSGVGSDAPLVMDHDGKLVSICRVDAQVARYEGDHWEALGKPFGGRVAYRAIAIDAQNRPVVILSHEVAASGSYYDYRLSLQRWENGAWTVLSERLNAPDKHLIVGAELVVTPDGVPLVSWVDGNIAAGSQPHALQVTETGTAPLPWTADLSFTGPTVDDGLGGSWLVSQEISTKKNVILHLRPGEATPEIEARDVLVPDLARFFRDETGHLAVFGRRGDSGGYAMTLQHLEGGAWTNIPGSLSDIMERAAGGQRIVDQVAIGPDGVVYALIAKSFIDSSTRPPTARASLTFARH